MTPAGVFSTFLTLSAKTGRAPVAGLIQGSDGMFYGLFTSGGANGVGTVLQVTSAGVFSVLHDFATSTGWDPDVSLIQHTSGRFYGNAASGGNSSKPGGVFYELDMGLGPFVAFVPSQIFGPVGKSIGILGQGFTGATKVAFNGTAASFKVASDTFLTATVPAGAKTGRVTVTTPEGARTSNKVFRVRPQLTTFNPTSGPVGTVVTITGVSLAQTTAVTIGSVKGTSLTVDSDNQVTLPVPTGAKTGKIVVTTSGGSVRSTATFTVTD